MLGVEKAAKSLGKSVLPLFKPSQQLVYYMNQLDKKLAQKKITPGQVIDHFTHFNLWHHIKKDTSSDI
jgi:hypothetical protein